MTDEQRKNIRMHEESLVAIIPRLGKQCRNLIRAAQALEPNLTQDERESVMRLVYKNVNKLCKGLSEEHEEVVFRAVMQIMNEERRGGKRDKVRIVLKEKNEDFELQLTYYKKEKES
jgi:hypothetical protein